MPELHHVAVPMAAAVMIASWVVELANIGWPRLLPILGIVVPNMWLTWLGRVSANELFLILILACSALPTRERVRIVGTTPSWR